MYEEYMYLLKKENMIEERKAYGLTEHK